MKYQKILIPAMSIFFIGCNEIPQIPQPHVPQNRSNFIQARDTNLSKSPMDTNTTQKVKASHKKVVKQTIKKAPKKDIKLKKVEDTNFSPDYMYPTTNKKTTKPKVTVKNKSNNESKSMTKDECISLIGQDRFNRYVDMLGTQSAALKRCELIKSQN